MAPGEGNSAEKKLDVKEGEIAPTQWLSEASGEKQQKPQVDPQPKEKSQDSDETSPMPDEKQEQEAKSDNTPTNAQGLSLLDAPRVAVTVPRSERRGLWGHFTIIPEVTNPRDYEPRTKWFMTAIVAFAAATSSTGSSIFYPALDQMAHDLHTTATVTNLSLAFYMLAMSITPLWWSAWSETLGRRTIYVISFTLFVIFSVISAVSVDIAMVIVFRILSGGAAASVQAVGAGTAADIWEPKERGRAMGLFYIGPLCGPGIAPVIGGALTYGLGWRSTLWFLAIWGGIMLILIIICLPETVAKPKPPNSDDNGTESRRMSAAEVLKRFVSPLKVLGLLRHPPIIIAVWSAAIAFGAIFVVNISIQTNFVNPPYNFTVIEVGLLYLAPTIGYAISSLLGGRWIDHIMAREAYKAGRYDEDGKLKYLPEDRMKENIWMAMTLYPAGLIWYGWAVQKELPWIVSCVANLFFGLGVMLVFGAVTTMLTEFTPKRSSSGVAINNFVRNILSCTGAIVTQPLINAMGTGWMCTMVGLFAFVTGNIAILALKTWGPKWRVGMDKKLNPQT